MTVQGLFLLGTISERGNYLAKGEERLVDIDGFLRSQTCVASLCRSLATCQVDQLKLAGDHIVNGRIVDDFHG